MPGTTQELFRIKKRTVGNNAVTYADIENQGDTAFDSTFSISDTKKFFTIPQLISELSSWAATFTFEVDAAGIIGAAQGGGPNIAAGAGIRWLLVDITASGQLILKCASDFLNLLSIRPNTVCRSG